MSKNVKYTNFIAIGTERLESVAASKVKITNLVAVVTCLITLLYALYFFFVLAHQQVAVLNLFFVACYALTVFFSARRAYRLAKSWFFIVLIVHVYLFNMYVFGVAAGFHFYYLIITPGVFLLFDEQDKLLKFIFSLISALLFFICEQSEHLTPLIVLNQQATQQLFLSVIYVTMFETFFIMALLSRNIDSYQKELKTMADTDALTGINNRRTFMNVGEELFEHAKRYHHPLSLLLLDIDYFKNVNDQYGHVIGDQALQEIASKLKNNLRASDVLARYGGEEFVIILPETSINFGVELAKHLRKTVGEIQIDVGNKADQPLTFSVSIGVAEITAQVDNVTQLLNHADHALYQAKASGRDQVVAFLAKNE